MAFTIKDTSYALGQNDQLLDILCNNIPSFKYLMSLHFYHLWTNSGRKSFCLVMKRWCIDRVFDKNAEKLLIFAVLASCIAITSISRLCMSVDLWSDKIAME